MHKALIEEAVQTAGFNITNFADHPEHFGSWYAEIEEGQKTYRLAFDGRNSTLALAVKAEPDKWLDLKSELRRDLSDTALAKLSGDWLRHASELHSRAAPDVELAAVRPHQTRLQRVGMYVFGALFFGLLPMALVIPFGPPPGHPVYLVAWAVGAILSTVVMHRIIDRMMENCHLSLTERHLTIGRKAPRTIPLADIVDTVPIFSGHKPFQKSFAAVNPEQFTVVLLRLRDGSRLPLAGVYRMQGFENFLVKLFGLVGPTIRTQGELSAGDLAVLGARNANKIHAP